MMEDERRAIDRKDGPFFVISCRAMFPIGEVHPGMPDGMDGGNIGRHQDVR